MTQSATAPVSERPASPQISPLMAWLRRDGNVILCAASALYLLLYLFFWPTLYSTMDESAYINLGYTIQHGTFYLDVAGVAPVQAYPVGPHILSMYPPGMGMLLSVVGLFGWNFALGLNLFTHLALFWTVAALLRRNQTPVVFALLYLLHPVAALFSRTILSDLSASLFLTLGFMATLKRRYVLCGVLVGLALWVRTVSVIAAVFFAVGILLEGTRYFKADDAAEAAPLLERIRRVVLLGVGVVPFFLAAFAYQKIVQDGGWAKYALPGMVSARHIPVQFPFYTVALLALYPFMLIAPLFYRGVGRAVLIAYCAGFFAFYCCFYFHDEGASKAETFLQGQRFLLVIIPLMIVAYSHVIWRWATKGSHAAQKGEKIRALDDSPTLTTIKKAQDNPVSGRTADLVRAAVIGLAVLLFVGVAMIHKKHADYLSRLNTVRQAALQASVPDAPLFCNTQLAKLLRPGPATKHLQILPASGSETGDANYTAKAVREALTESHRPVTIAMWSRAFRPENPQELALFHAMETTFETRPLPAETQSHLPDDLHVLQIIGERKQNESPQQ